MPSLNSPNRLVVLLTAIICIYTNQHVLAQNAYNELGKTTAQLARLRGFQAIDHSVITSDGYILNIVQAYSPLIDRSIVASKPPVLFVHGFYNNGNTWLINSVGAEPHDYSAICANATKEELLQLAKTDSGFNSVTITFMNCAREVWILNRRGNTQSRGFSNPNLQPYGNPVSNLVQTLVGGLPIVGTLLGNLSSIVPTFGLEDSLLSFVFDSTERPNSPRYWNFSLDEEARYDLPEVIDFVLAQTNHRKLDLVAHSSGGSITLMAQVNQPELAHKIGKTLLYAPAIYLAGSESLVFQRILPYLVSYLGQFLPDFIFLPIRAAIETLCTTQAVRESLCSVVLQVVVGLDLFNEPLYPGYADGVLDTISSHESAHLVQTAVAGKSHHFDYMDPVRNFIAYRQPTPPVYDVSKVISQPIAIWFGNTDTLVPAPNIFKLVYDLRVPVKMYFINELGVLWSHLSYFLSRDKIPSLVTVPSVKFLESDLKTAHEN